MNVELMIMLHAQRLVCQTGNKAPGERIKKLHARLAGLTGEHALEIHWTITCGKLGRARDVCLTRIPSAEYHPVPSLPGLAVGFTFTLRHTIQ